LWLFTWCASKPNSFVWKDKNNALSGSNLEKNPLTCTKSVKETSAFSVSVQDCIGTGLESIHLVDQQLQRISLANKGQESDAIPVLQYFDSKGTKVSERITTWLQTNFSGTQQEWTGTIPLCMFVNYPNHPISTAGYEVFQLLPIGNYKEKYFKDFDTTADKKNLPEVCGSFWYKPGTERYFLIKKEKEQGIIWFQDNSVSSNFPHVLLWTLQLK
jgi:hypothetical protein